MEEIELGHKNVEKASHLYKWFGKQMNLLFIYVYVIITIYNQRDKYENFDIFEIQNSEKKLV